MRLIKKAPGVSPVLSSLDSVAIFNFKRATDVESAKTEYAWHFPTERASLVYRQEPVDHRKMKLEDARIAAVCNHSLSSTDTSRLKASNATDHQWATCHCRVRVVFTQERKQRALSVAKASGRKEVHLAERQEKRVGDGGVERA